MEYQERYILVKKSKQIIIIGQSVYIITAAIFMISGLGLIAIIAAQASSLIIIRMLSYKAFFTKDFSNQLSFASAYSRKEILNVVYPNALKIGLTSVGGLMVQRSSVIIGSL